MTDPVGWHDAVELKPRLRDHVRIHRHRYRGRIWYVLQDDVSGRYARFTPQAHYLVALMDGRRTLGEIVEEAEERWGGEAPSPKQALALMSQLHGAGVLLTDRIPDDGDLMRRAGRARDASRFGPWLSPLAIRIPLFDPDRLLEALLPFTSWCFGRVGALLWIAVVSTGSVAAVMHWDALTRDVLGQALAAENLILLMLVYPVVKAIHELGHGIAVKRNGGEVHEMGIMLLVFIPVPYVDASASIGFSDRWQRALVAGAGILVELFLAGVAMLLWLEVEPGATRTVAYNVMIIAGISSLFFNGNPLLRFDGHFVLQDLLEIPNLGSRSNRHIGYLTRRYLLRQSDLRPVATDDREARWLLAFGVASFAYRMLILAVIVLLVADRFFFIGVALAFWVIWSAVVKPLLSHLNTLLVDAALIGRRGRAIFRVSIVISLIFIGIIFVPAPRATVADGLIRAPDEAILRAGTDGEIADLVAEPGTRVNSGDLLIRIHDPVLAAEAALFKSQLREAEVRLLAARVDESVIEANARTLVDLARSRVEDVERRLARLEVRSERAGLFLVPGVPVDLLGRPVRRGEALGYVLETEPDVVRVAVGMDQVDEVRTETSSVELITTGRRAEPIRARFLREVPAATDDLPSLAFSVEGGGQFALVPGSEEPRSVRPIFQFEVVSEEPFSAYLLEQRVFVKFHHPAEPLAFRWYRGLRRLFLSRFNV